MSTRAGENPRENSSEELIKKPTGNPPTGETDADTGTEIVATSNTSHSDYAQLDGTFVDGASSGVGSLHIDVSPRIWQSFVSQRDGSRVLRCVQADVHGSSVRANKKRFRVERNSVFDCKRLSFATKTPIGVVQRTVRINARANVDMRCRRIRGTHVGRMELPASRSRRSVCLRCGICPHYARLTPHQCSLWISMRRRRRSSCSQRGSRSTSTSSSC